MKRYTVLILILIPALFGSLRAEVALDGFVQGLFGGRLDDKNPTSTELTATETRLQLRTEHFSDNAEAFGRLDVVWDGIDSAKYQLELREAYLKFRLGENLDFKVGRQILTWGTGDLIFINDVFAKDYRSFFIGRDDQYLKAPQTAIRVTWYTGVGDLALAYSPRFEPNRLPRGDRLSYFSPFAGQIVGTGMGDEFFFDPPQPEAKFRNGEVAIRLSRQVGYFNLSGYFYRGFYKNPTGAVAVALDEFIPVYPRLYLYGASVRGQIAGGVAWLEGGYFDSRDDTGGTNPLMPNSSLVTMLGYERQVATNLTINAQWQVDMMSDYDRFRWQQTQPDGFVRDKTRHLITSRITKLLKEETLTLSGFVFYSPSDEDGYIRLIAAYDYSDELTLVVGANLFDGNHVSTDFGQFRKNDNAYLKLTYGF